MRRNGSARVTLEYRFSRTAETVGRLDGNERWQIIPTGRADWERTASRVDGMRLASFSGREEKQDIVNKVTLEFKDTGALLKFLDPAGKRASITSENGSNILRITLNEKASQRINSDLLDLMKQVSQGYSVRLSFAAQGSSTMAITDGDGKAVIPPPRTQVVSSGKKVSMLIDTGEILSGENGLGVIISWK
jgi:hypothetical protein